MGGTVPDYGMAALSCVWRPDYGSGESVDTACKGFYLCIADRICPADFYNIERNGISIKVLEGCYYVLGDNVDNSYDPRYWINPFIRKRDIVARPLFHGEIDSFELVNNQAVGNFLHRIP